MHPFTRDIELTATIGNVFAILLLTALSGENLMNHFFAIIRSVAFNVTFLRRRFFLFHSFFKKNVTFPSFLQFAFVIFSTVNVDWKCKNMATIIEIHSAQVCVLCESALCKIVNAQVFMPRVFDCSIYFAYTFFNR